MKKLSMSVAWQKLLGGECVSGREMSVEAECFCRHMAWSIGRSLQCSGVFDYKSYSLD